MIRNWPAHASLCSAIPTAKNVICSPRTDCRSDRPSSTGAACSEVGNTLFLADIPLGTVIHNIELYPGQGAAMARSAGSYAQLLAREGKFAVIKLPSGETRMVLVTCRATVGVVSNVDHSLESHGKAGRKTLARPSSQQPRCIHELRSITRWVVAKAVLRGHPRSRKGLRQGLQDARSEEDDLRVHRIQKENNLKIVA